jgi:hypothetical protein
MKKVKEMCSPKQQLHETAGDRYISNSTQEQPRNAGLTNSAYPLVLVLLDNWWLLACTLEL